MQNKVTNNIYKKVKKTIRYFVKICTVVFFYFKPRKVVGQYKLFFDDGWLELSVDSIVDFMYKIVFVISDISWANDSIIKGDNLKPVIEKLSLKYPNKIIVITGSWNKQISHVQAGLDYIKNKIPEATHCLYIDSDEVYKPHEMKKIFAILYKYKYFYKEIKVNYNCYFKTIFYKIYPNKFPLAMVLFPIRKSINYVDARNVSEGIAEFSDIYFEHFSYVRRSDENIDRKIAAHRETEPILEDWYNNVWMNWTPEIRNFHPTHPKAWESVIKVFPEELPKGVVELYERLVDN